MRFDKQSLRKKAPAAPVQILENPVNFTVIIRIGKVKRHLILRSNLKISVKMLLTFNYIRKIVLVNRT